MKPPVLEFLGASQGILLSVFFFTRSKRHLSNLMMGCYLFFFSIGLLENWANKNIQGVLGVLIQSVIADSSFLYGPFLYLFIHFIITNKSKLYKKILLHFIPFFLFLGLDLFTFFSGLNKSSYQAQIAELIFFEIFIIQILWYNLAAIHALRKHHKRILNTYSTIEKKDLQWLKILLTIITGIYIFSFTLTHLELSGIKRIDGLFIIVKVSIVICIYFMSYKVLFSPQLFGFSGAPSKNFMFETGKPAIADDLETITKYQRSGLKPDQASKYLEALQHFMNSDKPYTNPDLNIFLLSQGLSISKNHLTQILNEQLGENFYEFINKYRVKEAQALLRDPEYSNLSLAGIASRAGFKSKTTFFTNFKKITGRTPQEWLKKVNNTEI